MSDSKALFKIAPYNKRSRSAIALAQALDCLRLSTGGSWDSDESRDIQLINWGLSYNQIQNHTNLGSRTRYRRYLNKPNAVSNAANKIKAFTIFRREGLPICAWTTDRDEAVDWIYNGYTAVERHRLSSHSGQGIRLVNEDDELLDAPLYTRYINKNAEYRVHVFDGKVIDLQQKRRRRSHHNPNWQIRSHINGWNYTRDFNPLLNYTQWANIKDTAVQAVDLLSLDFGAVDLVTSGTNRPYVLEVNTAPGLTGRTLVAYATAFRNYYILQHPTSVNTPYFQALDLRILNMENTV
tara:strand:- start:2242 stop:3126 length:885 start_codon:yes stop_codon:yes gene_type:complete